MRAITSVICVTSCLLGAATASGQTKTVFHVRISGPLDVSHSRLINRALEAADREPGALIVFDIHSAGGRMDLAQLIAADLEASPHTTFGFVNTQAWSAASLVALATDSLYMGSESTIGGGDSVATSLRDLPAPAMQAMRDHFGALVERRGADPRLGQAMIDASIRTPGKNNTTDLLTLDATNAVEAGIAIGRAVGLVELLQSMGIDEPDIVEIGSAWTGTTVEVQNFNVQDARIFVVRGASRFRLGTVTSMGSGEFEVPGRFLPDGATIRIGIELIGSSENLETERIRVQPGLVIRWVIENALSQSSFSYYVR